MKQRASPGCGTSGSTIHEHTPLGFAFARQSPAGRRAELGAEGGVIERVHERQMGHTAGCTVCTHRLHTVTVVLHGQNLTITEMVSCRQMQDAAGVGLLQKHEPAARTGTAPPGGSRSRRRRSCRADSAAAAYAACAASCRRRGAAAVRDAGTAASYRCRPTRSRASPAAAGRSADAGSLIAQISLFIDLHARTCGPLHMQVAAGGPCLHGHG